MQPQQLQPDRFARAFWVGLSVTIALTLGLAGIIIWLVVTQNLAQLSVLTGLVASIVAIITAPLIFYFTVFKKPEKQEALLPGQKNGTEPLQLHPSKPIFARIAIDPKNKYWCESEKHPNIFGNREYFQFFTLTEFVDDADPSFDITLMNTTTEPVILTDIGIEIVCVAEYTLDRGIPESAKVEVRDIYIIDMPNIRGKFIHHYYKDKWWNLPPTDINELISIRIPDPIYLEAKAPYRYQLFLQNYWEYVPNYAIIRMWLRTNQKQEYSQEILLVNDLLSERRWPLLEL